MNIPVDVAHRAFEALSDEGLLRAAKHVDIPTRLPRAEIVTRLAASKYLLGCTHQMTLADLRAVANALGATFPTDGSARAVRAAIFAHDFSLSPNEVHRRARLAKLAPTPMSVETLLAEGRALALPVILLVPERPSADARPVAAWRGTGVGASAANRLWSMFAQPWLRVDLRAHPDPACRKSATLEILERQATSVIGPELTPRWNETPLFALPAADLPSIDVLIQRGGEAIAKWRRENEWEPSWGWNGNFPDAEPGRAYENAWRECHPLFNATAWAQLGGWPVGWGNESCHHQLERSLVLRTYRGGEPWVEVVTKDVGYRVAERRT